MSRKRDRRRARREAEKQVEQQSVNKDTTVLETSSNKQSPSDVNTAVDTLMQADSADLLPFPEHQSRDNVSTTARVSCQNALLEVESAAKFPSTEPMDLDLNPTENHLENNVAGKKKKKKKKNKNNCTAAVTNLQVTFPNAESAVQLPPQEPLHVTFPNAESAVQLPAQELQGLDMNLADNLEVKSGNRKEKKKKRKNLNKPTGNVLDVDSTAFLLAPKDQERDINLQVTLPNAESAVQLSAQEPLQVTFPNAESAVQFPAQELQGLDVNLADNLEVKSGNRKEKRKKRKNLNKPTGNVLDVDSTASLLAPKDQERDINLQVTLLNAESAVQLPPQELQGLDMNLADNLEVKSGNRKQKKRKNLNKPTSNVLDVDSTAKLLAPKNPERDINLQVTLPNAESAVQLSAQEPLQVTFPNAESAVQLPPQELQGLDMNLGNNLEVKSGNRKQKKRKKKNLNEPTSNVLDVDSTAKLLAPKNQERDINMTKIEEKIESGEKPTSNVLDVDSTAKLLVPQNQESDINMTEIEKKSESGEKSASGKKKRRMKKWLNKLASIVIDVESTAEVLAPEHHEIHDVLDKPTSNVLDVDSTTKLLAPKNQERDINMTKIEESSESGEKPTSNVLDVDSTAKLLVPKNQESDINMTEVEKKSESGEKSASGEKKRRKKKKLNKPASNVIDVESTAEVLAPEHHERDISSHNNLEQETANGPKNQERDINMTKIEESSESGEKPTSNVLDVDSTAKLLVPKNQGSDINMTEVEKKSESGEKKRRKKKKLNKPASNVIDVESTAEVLAPEHHERDISSHNNLEQETANGRKRKRGENIEPTSDDQHVELIEQLLPPDNQEKKKKKKIRKVKKAANNNIDNVKTATQDSLSFAREETEVLGAGSVKLCPEDVNVVSVQTEHIPTVKATTTTCENYENGSYLAFPEKNSVESCSVGTHLPSSAEVTVHGGTPLRRKLLILDLNGLLADIVMPRPKDCTADASFSGRAIFKRPFCDDFLKFCFERFNVAIWSSRSRKIIVPVVKYLLGDLRHSLLFCWDMSHSTMTRFKTLENRHKPLVCKDLRKIWDNPRVPWDKGDFDESNTLLLDDSPYKALLNPVHTTIFPYSYNYTLKDDNSLGPGGDLRVYLENLADAEHVQKYVEEHPFGQPAINEKSPNWGFYSRVIKSLRGANCGDSV